MPSHIMHWAWEKKGRLKSQERKDWIRGYETPLKPPPREYRLNSTLLEISGAAITHTTHKTNPTAKLPMHYIYSLVRTVRVLYRPS